MTENKSKRATSKNKATSSTEQTVEQVKAMKSEMRKKLGLKNVPFVGGLKGYHKALQVTSAQHWTMTDQGAKMSGGIPALHICTYAECDKTETKTEKFKYCKKCFTKYCSKECQVKDHKAGEHKQRCKEFAAQVAFHDNCDRCRKPACLREDFQMCKDCFFRPAATATA